MSRSADDIITTIRSALVMPNIYTGWRGRTQQEEALATACSPANMAVVLAHIDAQDAFLIAKTEELATVAGKQRGRAEKAERERDEAQAEAHRLFKLVMERDSWLVDAQAENARLREVLTKVRKRVQAQWDNFREDDDQLLDPLTVEIDAATAGTAPDAPKPLPGPNAPAPEPPEKCPACKGEGGFSTDTGGNHWFSPCEACGGTGKTRQRDDETLQGPTAPESPFRCLYPRCDCDLGGKHAACPRTMEAAVEKTRAAIADAFENPARRLARDEESAMGRALRKSAQKVEKPAAPHVDRARRDHDERR